MSDWREEADSWLLPAAVMQRILFGVMDANLSQRTESELRHMVRIFSNGRGLWLASTLAVGWADAYMAASLPHPAGGPGRIQGTTPSEKRMSDVIGIPVCPSAGCEAKRDDVQVRVSLNGCRLWAAWKRS